MLKKRIIFVLFYQNGSFHLSRNFGLQKVGDTQWLLEKFQFLKIGDYIDELIILDVSRDRINEPVSSQLEEDVKNLMAKIFVPLTLGGGIRTLDHVSRCFQAGADKVSLNWALGNSPDLISEISKRYGSQSVVASMDVRYVSGKYDVFCDYGQTRIGSLLDVSKQSEDLGAGELFITSIDRDGTGFGLDLNIFKELEDVRVPIIASGGAGKPLHFFEALSLKSISGVATGNLFNFMGSGFFELRSELGKKLPYLRKL
ncbi:MAG: imidazole glycerol phosphate synthase cyclase subunit [Porticoccaceae bacterium]|nr:imidazole glycerol phosphate synthase cyclase subunit [Porticoccaceae bacterium]|tara:strand:- start:464 stop:1234 length:771 start_codon:yes stop_codon:yes gene_type:complete